MYGFLIINSVWYNKVKRCWRFWGEIRMDFSNISYDFGVKSVGK